MTGEPIGFVGIGSIGFPMMAHLVRSGATVYVHDAARAALDRAAAIGAAVCASAKEVADRAALVMGCLPTPEADRAAVLAGEGIAAGERIRLYVDHSTVGSDTARTIADQLGARSVAMLDAPIAGGVLGAEHGELSIIASGEKEALGRAEPALRLYATKILHVSERIGDAQVVKLANNMIVSANLIVAAEALLFAVRSGLPAESALAALNECTAKSFATERLLSRFVIERDFASGFRLELMRKDLGLCLAEAERAGSAMFVCNAAKQFFDLGVAHGAGARDVTEVVCELEKLAGAEIALTRRSD